MRFVLTYVDINLLHKFKILSLLKILGHLATLAFTRQGEGVSSTKDRKENMARMQAFVAEREISVRQAWVSFGKHFIAQWMTSVYGAQYAGTTRKDTEVADRCLD